MKRKRIELDLSIDVGNTQVCVYAKDYKDIFDSCFNAIKKGLVNDNCIEFTDNKKEDTMYQVIFTGEQQKDYAKKKELANKVFISYALYRYVVDKKIDINNTDITINLALGTPVKEWDNETVSLMKSWFKKPISFECNGINIMYSIKRLIVCPQGLAYQKVNKSSLLKYDIAYIIDMGGFTVDVVKVVRGVAQADSVHSLKIGSVKWLTRLAEAIESDFEFEHYSVKQAELAVKNGFFINPNTGRKVNILKQYPDIIKEAANELVGGLYKITNKEIMASGRTILFGGGTYTWAQTLTKTFNNVKAMDEPEMQNAKDFFKMLKAAKSQNLGLLQEDK